MKYKLDPELVDFAASIPYAAFDDPVAARASLEEMAAPMHAYIDYTGLDVEDRVIEGPAQAPQVKVRLYTPHRAATQPVETAGLIYIHGGGFAVGSPDTEHFTASMLARELKIVVVSVDYRLAPEHPYPAGLEDCYTALCWLHQQAETLGVDRDRIGVLGQSAGGGLSAALALVARDRKGPALCFQYLGMPELDDRLQTTSMREFVDTPLWNRPSAVNSWKYYLGERYQPGGDDVPIYAAPARASMEDLRALPPAYITAMEFDPLRDEDVQYALKLMEAGVPVELHTFPGTFHGSALVLTAAVSQRQHHEMLDVLRRGLKLAA